jgi:hypothetical protein
MGSCLIPKPERAGGEESGILILESHGQGTTWQKHQFGRDTVTDMKETGQKN